MSARSLMVLGTASHVGKSILTAALCRIFARSGVRVAPFKAQNMSLNSAATVDGLEIGRAQALQAEAAGLFATADMNPILLKPESDSSCQVIVQGRIWKKLSAEEYHLNRVLELFPLVVESYRRLAGEYDLVILEGAGSPAEINLKDGDIVNMRMAAAADASCLLVVDIDRGGAFASLLGTLELLEPQERAQIRGFIINKFRGDLKLLAPGVAEMEKRLKVPCMGVVPWIPDMGLDEEDSVGLEKKYAISPTETAQQRGNSESKDRKLRIVVIAFPYLSNFTDFDVLAAEPSVALQFAREPRQLADADVIILPGSKQTIDDFCWCKDTGLTDAVLAQAKQKLIVGICGGMQMLGVTIDDPHRMEGGGQVRGLGLLPISTVMNQEKTTAQVTVRLIPETLFGAHVQERETSGYEIHLGETRYHNSAQPLFELRRAHAGSSVIRDGAQSTDGRIWGTYVHGLFDHDPFRHAFLTSARAASGLSQCGNFASITAERQKRIDRLANCVESSLNMDAIRKEVLGIRKEALSIQQSALS